MRYLLAAIFILAIAIPVHAEVYMYRDSAGIWHGVSSADQVPPEYRDQLKALEASDPEVNPEAQKIRDAIQQKDEAERSEAKKQIEKETEQAQEKLQETIKNEPDEIGGHFDKFYKGKLGVGTDGWQLTDYKIMDISVKDDEANIVRSGGLKLAATVKMQVTFYADDGTKVDRIYIYDGRHDDDVWSFYCREKYDSLSWRSGLTK